MASDRNHLSDSTSAAGMPAGMPAEPSAGEEETGEDRRSFFEPEDRDLSETAEEAPVEEPAEKVSSGPAEKSKAAEGEAEEPDQPEEAGQQADLASFLMPSEKKEPLSDALVSRTYRIHEGTDEALKWAANRLSSPGQTISQNKLVRHLLTAGCQQIADSLEGPKRLRRKLGRIVEETGDIHER